jgi:hypothetical protein
LVITSFLFFARAQTVYISLLSAGFLISLIFYIAILVGKDTRKSKLIFTIIIVIAIIIQYFSEPFFIDSSYRIYLWQHEKELATVNNILKKKTGEVLISKNTVIDRDSILTTEEKQELQSSINKLNVYEISKSRTYIFFGIGGWLDIHLGLIYRTASSKANEEYRHITGNWYR